MAAGSPFWMRPGRGASVILFLLAIGFVGMPLGTETAAGSPNCHGGSNQTPPVVSPIPAVVGTTLTTSKRGWYPSFPPVSYSYQWKRNGVVITGATSQSYTTTAADANAPGTLPITADVTAYGTEQGDQQTVGSSNHVTVTIPVSPANTAFVDTPGPTLTASPPGGNDVQYDFQVSTSTNFGTPIDDSGWILDSFFYNLRVPLLDGTAYYWRVGVRNPNGSNTVWSDSHVAPSSFTVMLPTRGSRDYWPMWSHGPVSVNEANGNLVLSAPSPSYPTATGSLGFSLSYNSQDSADHGFGAGWNFDAGDDLGNPPLQLVDHGLGSPNDPDRYDGVEVFNPDGSSDIYMHDTGPNYRSPAGMTSRLTKNGDGTFTLIDEDGTIYQFRQADAGTWVANLDKAETIDTGTGTAVTSYGWTGTPLKLTSASFQQSQGGPLRTLTFTWQCTGALLCVTGPDQTVTWKYIGTGGATGPLARVNDGTRDVVAFTYTNGLISSIKNANDLDPTHASPGYNGNHALTICYATVCGQPPGTPARVLSVSDGPITGQTPNTTSAWTFSYSYGSFATAALAHDHQGCLTGCEIGRAAGG